MTLPLLVLGFALALLFGYRVWGRLLADRLQLDDARATPACRREDGRDFVPTKPAYLFPQHFSAIAAAGPIAGPILACLTFGWLPCLLWIAFGVVLIGAVHDFTSLFASLRHDGRSVAEIAREHLGAPAGRAMSAFIWLALIYVIVAFTDITAQTFVDLRNLLRVPEDELYAILKDELYMRIMEVFLRRITDIKEGRQQL